MTRLVVVGSLNTDLSVRVPRLPRRGETVTGDDLLVGAGGKGANQAVAASRLGAEVSLLGVVGADQFGADLLETLEKAGVDVSGVGVAEDASTGVALVVVGPDGDNMITLSPGANARVRTRELDRALAGADALLLQLEIPLPVCVTAARAARAAGVPVTLNAAPLPSVVSPDLLALVAEADALVVNESEAEGLLAGTHQDPARLRRLGCREAVLTVGARGAYAVDGDGVTHVPAFAVRAVDAVGAGDAFCAALVLARAEGAPLVHAVHRACAAGALATTRAGAQGSLPTRAEVDELLRVHDAS